MIKENRTLEYKILTDIGEIDIYESSGKEKVYIAGAIANDPDHKARFERAKKHIEKLGYIVMVPTALPPGMTKADYMRIDFAMIDSADVVLFLETSYRSPGASLEFAYCDYVGKKYYFMREKVKVK